MKKPLIGVVPLYDIERNSYWMLPGYMKGIELAGGIPLMLPLSDDEDIIDQYVDQLDGFLFTGGQDLQPQLYHQSESEQLGKTCTLRDDMEMLLVKKVIQKNKPALGICRGIQLFNVALDGTLYQDLPTQKPSDILHRQTMCPDEPTHEVSLIKDTPLYKALNVETLLVNSLHHQAIDVLSDKLKPMAISNDGLIEAIYHPNLDFFWAVQWHPEILYRMDTYNQMIFVEFVQHCMKKRL